MCVKVCIEELSNQRQRVQWLSLYCLSVLNLSFTVGSTKMDLGPFDILPFPDSWVWSIFFRGHRRDIPGGKLSVAFQCASSTDSWSASPAPGPAMEAWWAWLLQHLTAGQLPWSPVSAKEAASAAQREVPAAQAACLASSSCNTLASRTQEPATVPGWPLGFCDSRHFSIQSFPKCPVGQISSKFCKNNTPAAFLPFSALWLCLL